MPRKICRSCPPPTAAGSSPRNTPTSPMAAGSRMTSCASIWPRSTRAGASPASSRTSLPRCAATAAATGMAAATARATTARSAVKARTTASGSATPAGAARSCRARFPEPPVPRAATGARATVPSGSAAAAVPNSSRGAAMAATGAAVAAPGPPSAARARTTASAPATPAGAMPPWSARFRARPAWKARPGAVWVNRGCRGEFAEARGNSGGNWGGPGGNSNYSVTCSSNDKRQQTCAWDDRQGRPALVQQLSGTACVEGRSWGYSNGSLWVSGGCRARFGAR
jgi:hypothetical protein